MSAKGRAPVISLLSSDDEVDLPAPRKQDSNSILKENVEPRRSSSKELSKSKASKSASTTSKKAAPVTERLNPSKPSSSSSSLSTSFSNVQKPAKKAADPITISSSPSASPPRLPQYATYTSYPKIFGGLPSDPILSQSSPVTRNSKPIDKPQEPIVKSKSKTVFEELLGSSSEGGISDGDRASPKRIPGVDTKGKGRPTSPVLSKDGLERLRNLYSVNEPGTKRRKVDRVDLQISSSLSPEPLPVSTGPGRKPKLTDAEKAARTAERDAARTAKAAEREAQKEQKKAEREAKILQRSESQAMSSANKLRGSHVQTTGEMIVNISSDFYTSPAGIQLRAILTEIKVESHAPFDSPVPNIIGWRRVVTAEWNPDEDIFVPVPRKIQNENHVLTVIQAKDFVALTNAPEELDIFITKIKTTYPTCKLIVLIEGLTKLINKSKGNQSRAYAAQVRNRMREDGGREIVKVDKAAQAVDEDNVEDALLKLQVVHGCLLCHTQDGTYTAESIGYYTQHISQIPYKHAKSVLNNSANFCMDVGQVPSGKNVEDTYNKMLQTVHMSTAGVASAIQGEYPSIQKLYRAFMDNGEDVLKDIRVARTGNGKALGPAMSRKIARVLTGTNEWELES
ncbi:hypothetical protein TWF679_009069 [Orbilia oligospora]|uniref:ERCC4 domain-containing protein n=1 Tax=Orbilia oligospora TaxID=2813651 RepID=A0A8H8V3V6_ORBOL|nr:hypothetical protein TWF679_009069 [Orbilia oligospora]